MARWLSRVLAVGLAATATLVVAVAALPAITPFRPHVVVSGSMVPAIPIGALVLTAPLDGPARPGDVITFPDPFRTATVVHRVVSAEVGEDGSAYVTKGDANDTVDGWRIAASAATGRVTAIIPFAGYALGTLQRPASRIGVGLLVLALLLASVRSLARRSPAAPVVVVPLFAAHDGHDHLAAWLVQLRRAEARRSLTGRSAA